MKKSLLVLAACFSLAAQAQPYRMEAYFADGRAVNLGSTDYWSRILTGYDTQLNPLLSLSSEEWGTSPFALATALDSIVICTFENAPTIGDYIDDAEQYTYTRRLIADVGDSTLLLASPKRNYTLFVANDEAWRRFFASDNPWNVSAYEELTAMQKKYLLYNYLLLHSRWERAFAGGEVGEDVDTYFRNTSHGYYDLQSVVRYVPAASLPSVQNTQWNELINQGGAYIGYTQWDNPLLLTLTEDFMKAAGMTDEDRSILLGDAGRSGASLYVNGVPARVAAKCLNGYVYEMEELAVPLGNMMDELERQEDCKLFHSFLNRYTMPYLIGRTADGKEVYRKVFFADRGSSMWDDLSQAGEAGVSRDLNGNYMATIAFNPEWPESRYSSLSEEQDMAVMFVPTDNALAEWWNSSTGQLVMNGKESWDDVENSLLNTLINAHLKTSFLNSFPSKFSSIVDGNNLPQGISASDVVRVVPANNGIIYVVNKVYTPIDYLSIVAPLNIVPELSVMGRAVACVDKTTYIPNGYGTILNDISSSFTLLAPENAAFMDYHDPIYWNSAWADGDYRRISFEYNTGSTWSSSSGTRFNVGATYQDVTDATSQSGTISATKGINLLKNILENSTLVMVPYSAESEWAGNGGYYRTKGGSMVYIDRFAEGGHVYGGGNTDRVTGEFDPATIKVFYNQSVYALNGLSGSDGNGVTLQLDKVVQPTLNSVLDALAMHEEFSEFYSLLTGGLDGGVSFLNNYMDYPDTLRLYSPVYYSPGYVKSFVVSFLGNSHYTLFAPTNEAMRQAYAQGLPSWSDVANAQTAEAQRALCLEIMDFVRLHFMDNSVATDGTAGYYKTQCFNWAQKVYREVYFDPAAGTVYPRDNYSAGAARLVDPVTKAPARSNLSNIMACDYRLTDEPTSDEATIYSTSHVLIHAIDAPLSINK